MRRPNSLSVLLPATLPATHRNVALLAVLLSPSEATKEIEVDAVPSRVSKAIVNVLLASSSRRSPSPVSQDIEGAGNPSAEQLRVTLAPSKVMVSLRGLVVKSGEAVRGKEGEGEGGGGKGR